MGEKHGTTKMRKILAKNMLFVRLQLYVDRKTTSIATENGN